MVTAVVNNSYIYIHTYREREHNKCLERDKIQNRIFIINSTVTLCFDLKMIPPPLNRNLIVVEGFEYPNDPRSYVVWGLMPLVGSPKANRS